MATRSRACRRRAHRGSWLRQLGIAVSLLAICAGGCSGDTPEGELPTATLGDTPEIQRAFRPLMRSWVLADGDGRQELDEALARFMDDYPKDELVRLASVLRAWNALERGEIALARKLSRSARLGPAGTARDLATLVVGSAERRDGDPKRALEILEPLLGRMIDDFATQMLDVELVLSALGAQSWTDALRFMTVWRDQSPPHHHESIDERIATLLNEVPTRELLYSLETTMARASMEEPPPLARLTAQELARRAEAEHNTQLAGELVRDYRPLLGRYGEAVARLAVEQTAGRVLARTVGLVMNLDSSALRRRSADVAAGMLFGLSQSGSRLVSREAASDPNDVWRALSEVASQGAAVVVAGVHPSHASGAAAFARARSLPVILLSGASDLDSDGSPFVFVLGQNPEQSVALLTRDLRERGAKVVAGIGPELGRGDLGVGLERTCEALPSDGELRREGVDALVLYDGAYCGREAKRLADGIRAPLAFGLGTLGSDPHAGARVLSAGLFPPEPADPRVSAWRTTGRPGPSWWHALGRDAAVLADAAVADLAETSVEAEVAKRRLEAASALAAARAELWTSDAQGFVGAQRLPRSISVTAR